MPLSANTLTEYFVLAQAHDLVGCLGSSLFKTFPTGALCFCQSNTEKGSKVHSKQYFTVEHGGLWGWLWYDLCQKPLRAESFKSWLKRGSKWLSSTTVPTLSRSGKSSKKGIKEFKSFQQQTHPANTPTHLSLMKYFITVPQGGHSFISLCNSRSTWPTTTKVTVKKLWHTTLRPCGSHWLQQVVVLWVREATWTEQWYRQHYNILPKLKWLINGSILWLSEHFTDCNTVSQSLLLTVNH